jgi:hypothetical protein
VPEEAVERELGQVRVHRGGGGIGVMGEERIDAGTDRSRL